MNSEHLQDLRGGASGGPGEANGLQDDLQRALGNEWAIGMVLAAYDHVLFLPWRSGEQAAWSAALGELMSARARIMGEVIPERLRSYRRDALVAFQPVG